MSQTPASELAAVARTIIDANAYMTLATADAEGVPWSSPVWFACVDYREFLWVSSPDARHSRNIAVRPDVAMVIFDSRQPPGTGQGVYVAAKAERVPEPDLDRGINVFSAISEAHAGREWSRSDVEPPARLRLYHALAAEHFVLGALDERLPVDPG